MGQKRRRPWHLETKWLESEGKGANYQVAEQILDLSDQQCVQTLQHPFVFALRQLLRQTSSRVTWRHPGREDFMCQENEGKQKTRYRRYGTLWNIFESGFVYIVWLIVGCQLQMSDLISQSQGVSLLSKSRPLTEPIHFPMLFSVETCWNGPPPSKVRSRC